MQFQDNLALRYNRFGNPREVLSLEHAAKAPAASGGLRVRMTYAPINPSDLIPVTGAYRHLIVPPMTAGYEGVGVVVSAPADMVSMVGQRVLPLRAEGPWQRYVDCDPHIAVPVPQDVPDAIAARAYINPVSALHLLRLWPVTGKTIIITGAGSGIASLLAQWAQAHGAANIYGIYRSPQRRDWVAGLGMRPVAEDDAAMVATAAKEADITFDAVGGPLGAAVLNTMRAGAEFVGYGLLSGQQVLPSKQTAAHHRRFHLRDVLGGLDTAGWQQCFRTIWPRLATVRLPDTQVFPLDHWAEALDAFDRPGRAEKPLLQL